MKKLQGKILFIFFITGIIILLALGACFITILSQQPEFASNISNTQIIETKILILISILVFSCMVFLINLYITKTITKPINDMLLSAQKVANGENVELIRVGNKKKKRRKTEVDEITNIISIMTSEMKQSLNDVKKQKREIEAILLHMTDGIIAFDKDGNIMIINPVAKELLNIENEKNFDQIFEKLDVEINKEAIMYLENWTSLEQKINIGEKNINIYFAPYKDENNLSSGVIAVVQDITEHVKLDNMRKEFVADVSHELKTPITSIIGYADTLQEGEYDRATQEKFLSVISSEGRRMADLVSDLLTLSRYDTNRVTGNITEFDLGELAKKCQEKLEIEIEKKHQEVECYVTADVPPIKADKNGIERVILNVLSNAVKYTPENGNIKIYVGFVYNDAYIKVIDNGIGIPKEDLGRVFERFYRVDKARSREMGGTGLGLSIAKEIIEQNKGSIDIKSEYGKGTEVVIRIPALKKEEEK